MYVHSIDSMFHVIHAKKGMLEDKMTVDEMPEDKMTLDEMTDEMTIDEMPEYKMTW
jgi:hypothetical protein